ncbi:MAG: AAA family ATPase [Planctomycetota bacterium]|nr:AAA family ATPase [Planctomycetota bacterium]
MAIYTAFFAETDDGKVIGEVLIPPFPWNPILSALGRHHDEAFSQLRSGLRYHLRSKHWLPRGFAWDSASLTRVSVDLRPGWRQGDKYFSGDRNYRLEVSVVHGEISDGDGCLAFIPRLPLVFYYFDKKEFTTTVRAEVQKFFLEAPVEEIAHFLPHSNEYIDTITINVPADRLRDKAGPEVSILDQVGQALTRRSLKKLSNAAYERDKEVNSILSSLREGVAGLLVVGESGVGKSSTIHEAFRRLLRGHTPSAETIAEEGEVNKDIPHCYLSSGSRIVAGMKYVGQWEERCRDVCEELASSNSILNVGDLVGFLTAGRSTHNDRGLDVIFRPYLERNEITIVLETTPRGLDVAERLAPGFTGLFKTVHIEASERLQTLRIIEKVLCEKLSGRPELPPELAPTIYELTHRFMTRGRFPGKAIPLTRELAPKSQQAEFPNREDIIDTFSVKTGIPSIFLDDNVPLAPSEVAEFFEKRLVGQVQARESSVSLVSTLKAGLNDPQRPIASMLLCGPTGVGKTELAKCLAEFFFSGRERLIRLDMSEYGLPGSLSRLIGDLHVGPGELTKRINDQPFSVVLFDEVEKANPAVFDVLMGLFDEGRLTDPFGKVADFRSSILVMTSNLGAVKGAELGFQEDSAGTATARFMGAVSEFFRPEFINRLDRIVMFSSLDQTQCQAIAKRELEKLKVREGFTRRGLRLTFEENVPAVIAKLGFDERYGARPLKRAIDRLITTPLAQSISSKPEFRDAVLTISLSESGQLSYQEAPA